MSVPVESVESRLARLEAPVKHEFCRLEMERISYVDALRKSGGGAMIDATAAPIISQRKSKNAMKKVCITCNVDIISYKFIIWALLF